MEKDLEQKILEAILEQIMFEKVEDVRNALLNVNAKLEYICNNPIDFVGTFRNNK